jgi:cell division septation protein DedD
MADEGFHEIQLNGKQLVFLFMAATVVSVVVFLLGVMVGRNVRQPSAQIAAAATNIPIDPTADPGADPRATVQSGSTNTTSDRTPLSAQETLTYAERLEAPEPPAETFGEPVAPAPAAAAPAPIPETPRETTVETVPAPTPAAKTAPVAAVTADVPAAGFTEPSGNGWVVQVMAAVKREEAESLAQRLTARGYPTFVSVGDGNVPAKFRVRVGKYTDRREAEAVELKLQQQEQFKTWLTR